MKKVVIVTTDRWRGLAYAKDRNLDPRYTWIDSDDSRVPRMREANKGTDIEVIYIDED